MSRTEQCLDWCGHNMSYTKFLETSTQAWFTWKKWGNDKFPEDFAQYMNILAQQNIPGNYKIVISESDGGGYIYKFVFENEQEEMLFKLRHL